MIFKFASSPQDIEIGKDREGERELFLKYLPLVSVTAQRIKANLPPHVEMDDLISAGIVGLLDAIRRYDPSREATFSSYVALKIKCSILSELRGRDFLSRGMRQRGRMVEEGYERLEKELGREPTSEEVAEALGISQEEMEEIERINSISIFSLHEIQGSEDKESPLEVLREESEALEDQIYMDQIYWPLVEALRSLDEKEKLVLSLYYVEELTMKEIAQVLNLTESRISQIHARAIRRLRSRLRKKKLI